MSGTPFLVLAGWASCSCSGAGGTSVGAIAKSYKDYGREELHEVARDRCQGRIIAKSLVTRSW